VVQSAKVHSEIKELLKKCVRQHVLKDPGLKSLYENKEMMCQAFKRLRKKSIRQLVRNGPGLKPLDFTGIFAGLKPCAPTEKRRWRVFRSL